MGSNGSVEVDELLQRLEEHVKKREFGQFENIVYKFSTSKPVLTPNQNQQLISALNGWIKDDHSEQEYAMILKSLASLKLSLKNRGQPDIIVEVVEDFLEKTPQSFRWFAVFLFALKGVNFSGRALHEKYRQRIVELLGDLKEDRDGKAVSELISGIVGVGIRWGDINEAGKRNLLNQLEEIKSEMTADHLCQILFSFGKLGVNLKESPSKKTILELTAKELEEVEKDNGQGKLKISRTVSMIRKYSLVPLD
jgi:hypothetical protein